MKKIILLGAVLMSSPLMVLAADSTTSGTNAYNLLFIITNLLGKIVPVLIAVAVVYFVWGVIQYTISTDEETKKGARGKIINGLIGLFVILSFWGIIALVQNTSGIGAEKLNPNLLPCVPAEGIPC